MATKDLDKSQETTFDKKWLKGLTFRGSTPKETVKDGRKKTVHQPFERPLTEADVISWVECVGGDEVSIVAADGRKYRVTK